MTLAITTAHRAARNAASIALADAGAGNSSIKLYTAEAGTLLAVRTLDKPCGSIVPATGRIALAGSASADLVLVSGITTWAAWCDGDGNVIASGAVTDGSGPGPFKLKGSSGTQLYEGGVVPLDGDEHFIG